MRSVTVEEPNDIPKTNPAPVPETGEIHCARVYEADILRRFYLQPKIWEPMRPDGAPLAIEVDFECLVDPEAVGNQIIFVVSRYESYIAGLFMFERHTPCCYIIHSAVLPEFWGAGVSHKLGIAACKWMLHTDCEKIITFVPTFNELALKLAEKAGMTREGVNRASFKKNGVLYDQTMLGFTKEEILCL